MITRHTLLTLLFTLFCLATVPVHAGKRTRGVALPRAVERTLAAEGAARVIVGLTPPAVRVGSGKAVGKDDPLEEIADRQEAVLSSLPPREVASVKRYGNLPYVALEGSTRAIRALQGNPNVTAILQDGLVYPDMASSNGVIGSAKVWNLGYTGDGTAVAVLDSGVDTGHNYFSTYAKVVSEACYSTTNSSPTPPNTASVTLCPGGVEESTDPGSGAPCDKPGCWHGTHVAGTVAGNNNAGPNFGVAKGADIVSIQIYSYFPSSNQIAGYWSDILAGLDRAYTIKDTYNLAAVNMSLGGGRAYAHCDGDLTPITDAITLLRDAGVATLIASGNNGYRDSMGYPGCISTAVSVGATTDGDLAAGFSNVANFLDLFAPGVSITSAYAGTAGSELTANGTSMATPHVAGAWAVLKAVKPAMTVDEGIALLQDTGRWVNVTLADSSVVAIPRINLDVAVALLKGDLDGDGDVDSDDYTQFMAVFGTATGGPPYDPRDYNGSGNVDFFDYQYFYNFQQIYQNWL